MNPFALTAEERAGAMMAPARTPDVGAFMDNLGALRAMLGPSVAVRMQEHGEDQEARWDAGERGPTPLTEENVWLADDVAGSFVGPMGMAGVIKAYHGSPHRFSKFDLGKIGTGEGAQAYGHGLYFAENEGVAKGYQSTLSRQRADLSTITTFNGKPIEALRGQPIESVDPDQFLIHAHQAYGNIGKTKAERVKQSRLILDRLYPDAPDAVRQDVARRAEAARPEQFATQQGALYTTRLDVEPEDLLDYDAPLSEQSAKVRAALSKFQLTTEIRDGMPLGPNGHLRIEVDPDLPEYKKYFMKLDSGTEFRLSEGDLRNFIATNEQEVSGKTILSTIAAQVGGEDKASQALREAGIPGIRYLDQGSRASGEGTRNFVIFDDKLISIESVD